MLTLLQPMLFALVAWWFSTGLIIFLDGLPRHTFGYTLAGASMLAAAGLWGLHALAPVTTVAGAYGGFLAGLLVWSWLEVSFYTGLVTGPRKAPCAEGCSGWTHLGHAVAASLWHELAILGFAAAVMALSWGQPNAVGAWTFLTLWWMHQSAKLNVFLGVRNLNAQFLPDHLVFLRSFLREAPINLLFPVSITVSTVVCSLMVGEAMAAPAASFRQLAWTFTATLMVLAIIEHWVLVLPLPFARLWDWSLAARPTVATPLRIDVVAGFLGAGKTTVMRRLLDGASPAERTLVLANDFASLGIDGALLAGRGAEVLELANGCICCTLRDDLAGQLTRLAARHAPHRVLIEPSGVADLAALLGALRNPALASVVGQVRVTTVIDAGAFLADYARRPSWFEAQVRVSRQILVNKVDLAQAGALAVIRHTLQAIQPGAELIYACHGVPEDGRLLANLPASRAPARPTAMSYHPKAEPAGAARLRSNAPGPYTLGPDAPGLDTPRLDTLGLESWSSPLQGSCDALQLRHLLDELGQGGFGELARVKGIARAGAGWVRFDLAGGQAAIAAHAPQQEEFPRVLVIGQHIDRSGLLRAFQACILPGVLQHG